MNERQILYGMLYEMRLNKEHWSVVNKAGTAAAVGCAGRPAWVWLDDSLNDDEALFFIRKYLEKYGIPKAGLVARKGAARLGAEWARRKYVCGELIAYHRPNALESGERAVSLATSEDRELLREWISLFYAETFGMELKENDSGEREYFNGSIYILKEGKPAAMGILCGDAPETKSARINLVYVPKELRRRGYGRRMVSALTDAARAKGKLPVLYTYADNAAANALYLSLGFLEAGRLEEVRFI